jgi:hypothetical protein
MSQIQCRGLLKKNKEKETQFFNFTLHGIDDFLSLNNSKFCEFDDNIHLFELEYRLPHNTTRFPSYLDLYKYVFNKKFYHFLDIGSRKLLVESESFYFTT